MPLHPTIETNSIEFMKKIARNGHAITFLNPVDVDEEVQAGTVRHLPLPEISGHPISLRLMVRARGGLEPFRASWSRNSAKRCQNSSRSLMPDGQRAERKTALVREKMNRWSPLA